MAGRDRYFEESDIKPGGRVLRGTRPRVHATNAPAWAIRTLLISANLKVFGRRPSRTSLHGGRKPSRDETAARGTYWAVPRAQLWGFGRGWATAKVGAAME